MALTAKQEKFCQEYMIDLNATQAAIRAGYSKKTAKSIARENLTKPYLKARIEELQNKLQKKTEITQERVLQEYARIAFLDISKLYDENGNLKEVKDLDEDTARAIGAIEVVMEKSGNKEDYVKKIKLIDKKGALDSLSRHLGMFNDKIDVDQTVNVIFKC